MLRSTIEIMAAAQVRRYHTVDHVGAGQSIADHSWGVAVLVDQICESMTYRASADLYRAALYHDVAERWTGDVPATTKWDHPDLKDALDKIENNYEKRVGIVADLDEDEKKILKTADMLELCFWSVRQLRMGNKNFGVIFSRGIAWLSTNGLKCIFVEEVIRHLTKEIHDA